MYSIQIKLYRVMVFVYKSFYIQIFLIVYVNFHIHLQIFGYKYLYIQIIFYVYENKTIQKTMGVHNITPTSRPPGWAASLLATKISIF